MAPRSTGSVPKIPTDVITAIALAVLAALGIKTESLDRDGDGVPCASPCR